MFSASHTILGGGGGAVKVQKNNFIELNTSLWATSEQRCNYGFIIVFFLFFGFIIPDYILEFQIVFVFLLQS